jgi:16S rRNA G966 N2-methylase RsmD
MDSIAAGALMLRKTFLFARQYGARETAGLVRKNVAERARQYLNRRFDRKYSVDTSGVTMLSQLTCDGNNKEHGVWYEPTPLKTLKTMFSMLPDDVSEFTFIDFGSGKGRTLLYASTFGFRRIIGVEFAKELHAIAERNIRTFRNSRQKCFDITSVRADAVEFSLPEDKCVLYFFHPFREEVMTRVLRNIEASYRKNPRKLIVLYYHPQLNSTIEQARFLSKREEKPMPFDLTGEPCPYRRRLAVYETEPPAVRNAATA